MKETLTFHGTPIEFMEYTPAITSFQGEHHFLSNFWPARVLLGEQFYPTVEHAYQAAKTIDTRTRSLISIAGTPAQAKRLGGAVQLRPGWEAMKLGVMGGLVEQKFAKGELRDRLLATGDAELVEGNNWGDTFWGVCRGVGENHLGRILMDVRERLRA